jgi:hypothetical protein
MVCLPDAARVFVLVSFHSVLLMILREEYGISNRLILPLGSITFSQPLTLVTKQRGRLDVEQCVSLAGEPRKRR